MFCMVIHIGPKLRSLLLHPCLGPAEQGHGFRLFKLKFCFKVFLDLNIIQTLFGSGHDNTGTPPPMPVTKRSRSRIFTFYTPPHVSGRVMFPCRLSMCLSLCLSVCLSVCPPVHPSVIRTSICTLFPFDN